MRLRDMALVEKELQFFIDHEVPQVKFVDRTFNCNKKHAMAIWRYIKAHDNGITNFHFEIGADLLDDEELAVMAAFVTVLGDALALISVQRNKGGGTPALPE